jgi:ubiquinone biosynthesis protein
MPRRSTSHSRRHPDAASRALSEIASAGLALPRLSAVALRHGVLPSLPSALALWRREGRAELHWKALGDALARTLAQAGPVFTKLGQILATREDWLPHALARRLEALYDAQPPMTARELRRALELAFPQGSPFAELDAAPLGVGSIGQVHRARLADGRCVVVKLLRPRIEAQIQRDLAGVRGALRAALAALPVGREEISRALEVLAALERGLLAECDLVGEASAYQDFGARLAGNLRVRVPACHTELCSPRALVLEELVGVPLASLRSRSPRDATRRRAADLALREILAQVFEDGRFHADPHGGNLLWLEDGRIGLIDLGLTGELTRDARRQIARAVRAFLSRDADGVLRALLALGHTREGFDFDAFRAEVSQLFAARGGSTFARLRGRGAKSGNATDGLEDLIEDLLAIAHRHGVRFPDATTLLIKTLVTIEGLVRSLDPELDVVAKSVPLVLASMAPPWLRFGRRRAGVRVPG